MEVQVSDQPVSLSGMAVVDDGVYYFVPSHPSRGLSSPNFHVRFLDASSGKTRDVATVAGPQGLGLSVTPDRRSLLFSRDNPSSFDVKLARRAQ